MNYTNSEVAPKSDELTYLILLQHHEIEVLDSLICVISHSFLEGSWVDDIADVFIDEAIPENRQIKPQTAKNRILTHFKMLSSARRPYPFFSVITMLILAYIFF